jgi:hypothetical protein
MNESEINEMLKSIPVWVNAPDNAKSAFIKSMRIKQYGQCPLLDAVHWFMRGWYSKEEAK